MSEIHPTPGLFAKEPIRERVVVTKDGPPVPKFSIRDGQPIERELVNEAGEKCDSVGKAIEAAPAKVKKKKDKP